MRTRTRAQLLSVLMVVGWWAVGCGDDGSGPAADSGPGSEAGVDLSLPADQALADGTGPDSAVLPDGGPGGDLVATDGNVATVTLSGTVSVSGVSCGGAAANDCKGMLYVGVVDKPAAPPQATLLGSAELPGVDLAGGKTASYTIAGLPAGKTVYLAAMLAESGQLPHPVLPQIGDLVAAPVPVQLVPPGPVTGDVQLAARWGGP